MKVTKTDGTEARAKRNGIDPLAVDVTGDDFAVPDPPPDNANPSPTEALPPVMLAYALDVDPGEPICDHLDAEQWESLREFGRRLGLGVCKSNPVTEEPGTTFEDINVFPTSLAARICPKLEGVTRADVVEFIDTSYAAVPDPLDEWNRLTEQRDQAKRERQRQQQALKAVNVNPRTRYTLTEIERVCGAEVSRRAYVWVAGANRLAWSAERPHDFKARTDLIAAGELVEKFDVDPALIADMTAAGYDDVIDANERLARARKHYARHGTLEVIDIAGEVVTPGMMRDKEPPRRLLGHWLFYGQLSELIGEPGSGKTFVAIGMMGALATGRHFNGHRPDRRVKVLYVAAEAPESVYLRLFGWCVAHGVAPEDLDEWFYVYPKAVQLADPEHMREVRKFAAAKGIEQMVYDTRHLVTLGLDENSAGDQGTAIKALKLLNEAGVGTLVVHHTTKDGKVGDGGRGSGAWYAAAYTSMYLKNDRDKGPLLVCDKIKDGKDGCDHALTYIDVTVPQAMMPKARPDDLNTRALKHIDPLDAAEADPKTLTGTQRSALHLVAIHAGAKGMSRQEMLKLAKTDADPGGYDIGKSATVGNSLMALRGDKGNLPAKYVRKVSGNPDRYRATDDGWDLLVVEGLVPEEYAASHRHSVEDIGKPPYIAACKRIDDALRHLEREAGSVLPLVNPNQTMTQRRKLVESHMQQRGQEFSEAAWAEVYAARKDGATPGSLIDKKAVAAAIKASAAPPPPGTTGDLTGSDETGV